MKNFIMNNLPLIITLLIGAVVCLVVCLAIFRYELHALKDYVTEDLTQRYVTKDGRVFIVTRREANLLRIISAEEARNEGPYHPDNNPSKDEMAKGISSIGDC